MKNALSMQIILNPNIELIRQRIIKGTDRTPLNAGSSGRNRIGPARKKLLIPKEDASRLTINERRGKTALKSL